MKIKPGINDVLWMATGTVALLACILVVWHFHSDATPAAQLAFKARRADLVGRMQLDLVSASEAEKSAVLAITDQDSQAFADQARADSAKVEQARRELDELLATGGTPSEKDLLTQFTTAFAEFQRIDKELLALLPPHIAEEDEKKEDEMEVAIATEDAQVRKNLEALAKFSNDSALATARYAEFSKLKTQIIALSRENTNVRSLSISLHQKRKVMWVCQDALSALQQAILAEPIAGITYGTPVNPR